MASVRCWLWPLGLLALSGCGLMVRHRVDKEIRELSAKYDDGDIALGLIHSLPPPPTQAAPPPVHLSGGRKPPETGGAQRTDTPRSEVFVGTFPAMDGELQRTSFEQKDEASRPLLRLPIPKGLPGADAPDFDIPTDPEERERYFDKLYPPVPPLPPMPPPAPGPEGRPLSLTDLQRLGESYSPAIKYALAAVEAAKGAAYQAGMYPNPEIAYEHDTVETGPAGYPGGYVQQQIITGGKLALQQAMASMDVLMAKMALRRAKADLWTQVRSSYFAVLVALQGIRYYEALFQFAEYLYEYQIKQLRLARGAASYEPMQLRPLVLQARLDSIQARYRFAMAWKQLTAALGLPDMPPSQLAGGLDQPMPVFDYDAVLARLVNHTDVRSAFASIQKAKYNLDYQKVVPLPNIGARMLIQKDYSTPPNQVANSAIMYMTIPVWNQNQGAIRQAAWLLAQANAGPTQARNSLIATLADAFNRYLTARQQVDITMQQMHDLLRAYRAAWLRHQTQPQLVSFSDLWPVQTQLENYVNLYITALGAEWQAAVDVANLLQTEDFFQSGQRQEVPTFPVLEDLLAPLRDYPRAPIARSGGHQPPESACSQGANAPRSEQTPPEEPAPQPPAPAASPQLTAAPRRTQTTEPDP